MHFHELTFGHRVELRRIDELAQNLAALAERVEAVAADVAYLMEENQALQMLLSRLIDQVTLDAHEAPSSWEGAGLHGRGPGFAGGWERAAWAGRRGHLRGSIAFAHRAFAGRAPRIRPWIPAEFAGYRYRRLAARVS